MNNIASVLSCLFVEHSIVFLYDAKRGIRHEIESLLQTRSIMASLGPCW